MPSTVSWWEFLGEGPLLYLSPHSDDAAFASLGLLHACGERGVPVHLVTCFSRSAYTRHDSSGDVDEVSALRKREDRAFASTLPGSVELEWLDLDDAPLRPQHLGRHPCKETSMTAADRALVDVLERRLGSAIDGASVVAGPLGIGRHIDHLVIRDFTVACAQRRRARVALWEDLPYAGRVTLEQLQDEIDGTMGATGLELVPTLLRDERLEARKRAAMACYPSQVADVHRRGILGHLARLTGDHGQAERLWLARSEPPA